MKKLMFMLLLFIAQNTYTQNIVQVEYFIDTDPGFGNGTPVSVTPGTHVNINFTADLNGLEPGMHTLFVRAKDENGSWSIAIERIFEITETPQTPPEITSIKYYFEKGGQTTETHTFAEFTPSDNVDLNFVAALVGLEEGTYNLHLFAETETGLQSLEYVHVFEIKDVSPPNRPPLANAGPEQTVECATTEGAIVTLDASGSSDPDNDPLTYIWSEGATTIAGPTTEPSVEVTLSSGEHLIELAVDDGNGGIAVDQVNVTVVDTESPTIVELLLPTEPVQSGAEVKANASFIESCSGVTATWDWGDGNTSEGLVDQGAATVSGSHVYQTPGVYSVKLTLTDGVGNLSESTFQFVVIFDPTAGFVTGGGWIDSPPGAYTPDPSLVGKANFGFVSKYQKGQSTPEGNTQFQFKVADLKFSSTSYDWLVIAGPNAKYKGSGTINGEGDYGFMLTARDGDISGGGGLDKFRIKIWEKTAEEIEEEAVEETVIYDNQMGDSDDSEATDAIEGGSIVIHSTALSKEGSDNTPPQLTAEVIPEEYALEHNYPNPFNPTTIIRFALPEAITVKLTIYDINGREVRRLLSGNMEAGFHDIQWDATDNNGVQVASGIYLYRLQVGSFTQTRKMTLLK